MRPERLDRWMARRVAAYYATRDPFADFTTAPEITQAFGECLGAFAACCWEAMGRPDPVILVEAGPGRGTLMADLLRAVGTVAPAFRRALRLHLLETSAPLRAVQARRLAAAGPVFHERLATLPPGPLLLIANEWLDALPIRQFLRRGGTWRERVVQAGRPAEAVPEPPLPPLPAKAPEGAVVEVSEAARTAVSALAGRLAAAPGVALFLDYGPAESGFGDTLQALRAGRPVDPFGAEPADITAHVDFAALAAAARTAGATVHGPLPQGVFLQRIGLAARAAVLAAAEGARGARHLAAAMRLLAPEAMGRLFKAFCLTSPGLPAPPGFAEGPPSAQPLG